MNHFLSFFFLLSLVPSVWLRAVASLGESNVLFHLHNVDTLLPEYIQSKREMAPILILPHSILHNTSLVKVLKVKEFLHTFENWNDGLPMSTTQAILRGLYRSTK